MFIEINCCVNFVENCGSEEVCEGAVNGIYRV